MIRVVKVGGSLLDWPSLPRALQAWLNQQQPAFNVLIAGGGAMADVIRQADRNFQLGEERSHWLCIDAMSVTSQILAAMMADYRYLSDFPALKAQVAAKPTCCVVFDARDFLLNHEPQMSGAHLSRDWSVTSDSIAARLTHVLSADELVLLKSADPPNSSLADLDQCGFVDRFFPVAAAALSPRFVNLRSTVF